MPPLVIAAVNVTDVPAQIVLSASLDVMLIVGVTAGSTLVVIVLLATVTGEAHVALLVRETEICSPFIKPVVVSVVFVSPAIGFTPENH